MDINYIKDAVWFIMLIGSVVGLYWKLRTTRPTYEKVDKMIVEKAYSKTDGIRLEEQFKAANDNITRLEHKLDEIAADVKKILQKK